MKLLPYVCVPLTFLCAVHVDASYVRTVLDYKEALGSPKATYISSTNTSNWELVTNTLGLSRFDAVIVAVICGKK